MTGNVPRHDPKNPPPLIQTHTHSHTYIQAIQNFKRCYFPISCVYLTYLPPMQPSHITQKNTKPTTTTLNNSTQPSHPNNCTSETHEAISSSPTDISPHSLSGRQVIQHSTQQTNMVVNLKRAQYNNPHPTASPPILPE